MLSSKKLLEEVVPILTTRKNWIINTITFLELIREVRSQGNKVN